MKAPIPFKSCFDELASHAQCLEHKDLFKLIRAMQVQVQIEAALPARLTELDTANAPTKAKTGGVL